jgi:two-component system CheB/CheR fusion protein
VRLPLAAGGAATVTRHRPSTSIRLPKGAKVVVVEDSADSRETLCELLSLAGFDCHSAGDGLAGLALIGRVRPHVALVDLGLPGIDGFELARRMREDPSHAPTYLIALTGYGQQVDRTRALQAGFDEHLVKPIDSRVLMRMLMQTDGLDGHAALDGAVLDADGVARRQPSSAEV